jgi:hypothetical protein
MLRVRGPTHRRAANWIGDVIAAVGAACVERVRNSELESGPRPQGHED